MKPFDLAWRLLKAPYDVTTQAGLASEPFEGTLYSGGDVEDTPKYYTPSLERALQYALYGSATGDIPMRETSPAIRVVQDPGFDEEGLPAGSLIADSQLRNSYMQDPNKPIQGQLMSDDDLRAHIANLGTDATIGDSTGFFHSEQDRKRHIEGALQRLRDKKGSRLDLTDSEKMTGGVSTGRHDELDAMDFDDISSGWDFLEDWERSWLLANRFDELPMWVQEQYQDDVKTGEPMDLAFRLLKAPVYTDDNPPPMQQSRHYEMLPELDKMGGYMWQSEDGLARGTLRPDYFLNSLMINNFEMAGPVRGQNKSRQYLQDMIDQGHGHFGHELTGTHVTNVESHTADFWNKLVDEGMLDGAHERANIRTNLDGDQHFVYAYDKETKQPWNHELSEDYADYHGLPTDAVYDNI